MTTAICSASGSRPKRATDVGHLHRGVGAAQRSCSIGLRSVCGAVPPVRISSALSGVMPRSATQVVLTTASISGGCCDVGADVHRGRVVGAAEPQVAVVVDRQLLDQRACRCASSPPATRSQAVLEVCATVERREVAVRRRVDRGDGERLVLDRRPGPARSARRPGRARAAGSRRWSAGRASRSRRRGCRGAEHAGARAGRRRPRAPGRASGRSSAPASRALGGAGAALAPGSDGSPVARPGPVAPGGQGAAASSVATASRAADADRAPQSRIRVPSPSSDGTSYPATGVRLNLGGA